MKKFTFLFIFIFIYYFNHAQVIVKDIHIAVTKTAYERPFENPIFLENDEGKLYFYSINIEIGKVSSKGKVEIKNYGNKITLFEYSDDLSKLSKTEIVLPLSYATRKLMNLKILKGKLQLFSMFTDIKTKHSFFYTETFNLVTGKSNQDEKKVAEKENWTSGKFSGLSSLSPNKSKYLEYTPNSFNNADAFSILVFDENYSIMNKNTDFVLKHYDYSTFGGSRNLGNLPNNAVKVDDKGGIYFLRKVYNEADIKTRKVKAIVNRYPVVYVKKDEQFYSYILYRAVKENNYKLESYPIEAKSGYFIKDAFLSIIGNDSILISGNYSKKGDINADGAFSIIPDFKEEKITIQNHFSYSKEFITLYLPDWEKAKFLKVLDKGKVWDCFDYNAVGFEKYLDGYILFIEPKFDFIISDNLNMSTIVKQFHSLMGIYINKDGTINDVIKIPKLQEEIEQAYASLAINSIDNNNIQIVFNGPSVEHTGSTNSITAIVLDKNKKISEKTISTKKDYKRFIYLYDIWVKPNVILGSYKESLTNRKQNLILVTLEE